MMKWYLPIGVLVFLNTGCTSLALNRELQPPRPFNQSQLIEHLISYSKGDMLAEKDTLSRFNPDYELGPFWIVPDSVASRYSNRQVWHRINGGWAGSSSIPWKCSSPSMDCTIFFCDREELPFPVTAEGIELVLTPIGSPLLVPQVMYCIENGAVRKYAQDEMDQAGLDEVGENQFRFHVPQNDSSAERCWLIDFHYRNPNEYTSPDPITAEYMETNGIKEWSVSTLRFLQLKDSVYSFSDSQLMGARDYFNQLNARRIPLESNPVLTIPPTAKPAPLPNPPAQ